MALYDVTVTGRYRCRGADGRWESPISMTKTYQIEIDNPSDSWQDQASALLDADSPVECERTGSYDFSDPVLASGPLPLTGKMGADVFLASAATEGELVTVYAIVACENQSDGSITYRTVRVDVRWDATVDEVIEALFEAAEAMVSDNPSAYPCNIIGITVTAPAYFQYLTVA